MKVILFNRKMRGETFDRGLSWFVIETLLVLSTFYIHKLR